MPTQVTQGLREVAKIIAKQRPNEERQARLAQRRESGDGPRFLPHYEHLKKVAFEFKKSVNGLKLAGAQNCLAYMFGFRNLSELQDTLKVNNAVDDGERWLIDYDERLDPEALELRRSLQAQRLTEWLDIEAEGARHLVELLRPSAASRKARSDDDSTASFDSRSVSAEDDGEGDEEIAHDLADLQWRFLPPLDFALQKQRELKTCLPRLSHSVSKRCMARIYGYRQWTELEAAAQGPEVRLPEFDEDLPPLALEERRSFQARHAQQMLSLDPVNSRALIDLLQPSARGRSRLLRNAPMPNVSNGEDEFDALVWQRINQA
jgi:hypothetical protein